MSVQHIFARRAMRVAFFTMLSAVVAGVLAAGAQGPWSLFHGDPTRKGLSESPLPAHSSFGGAFNYATPDLRWNFPHFIPNRIPAKVNQPMPWNMGHISASPTVGPGLSPASGNELFIASYDRYKFEFPADATPIDDKITPNDKKYQDYNLSKDGQGTVWGFDAAQGSSLNELTGDWWWGYRDAQLSFRTFEELNGQANDPDTDNNSDVAEEDPPDSTPKNPGVGIHVRRISDRTSALMGDNPNVVGLTPAQINAGGRPGTDPFNFREFQFLRLVSRAIVAAYPTPVQAENPGTFFSWDRSKDEPVGIIRSTPSYFHTATPINYKATPTNGLNLNQYNDLTDPYGLGKPHGSETTFSTSDVLVFGAEDGFVYCLDVSPANLRTYSWTDPEGEAHTTRVPNLMWRFYTYSLANYSGNNGEQPVNPANVSSALITDQLSGSGYPGPVAVIGTGVGYMAVLDLATGTARNAVNTSYQVYLDVPPVKLSILHGIQTSPALATDTGGLPWVIFGADDGFIYAWDPDLNKPGRTGIQWRFNTQTGENFPGALALADTTGFNTPKLVASPVSLTTAEAGQPMLLVGATTPKGGTGSGGTVYGLNTRTGAELWNFQKWYDYQKADATDPDADNDTNKAAVTQIGEIRATPAFSNTVTIANRTGPQRVAFVRDDGGNLFALLVDPAIASDPLKMDQPRMAWDVPFDIGGESAYSGELFSSSPVVTQDGKFVYIGSGQGRIRAINPSGVGQILLSDNNTSTRNPPFSLGVPEWQFLTGIIHVTGIGRAGQQSYEVRGRPIIGTPALAPGFLYVPTDGAVFAYQSSAGAGTIVNPFFNQFRIPTTEEQPSGGAVDLAAEEKRPQAEIVSQAKYGNAENETDVNLDYRNHNNISHTSDPTAFPGADTGVKWNAQAPGRLEWGDPVYVIAWQLDEQSAAGAPKPRVTFELQGPSGTVRLQVPVTTRATTALPVGQRGFAKAMFVLDPYSPLIVVRDPDNPAASKTVANPFKGNPITPGGDGTPSWTVMVSQAGHTSNTANTLARFRVNNPIELYEPGPELLPGVEPTQTPITSNLTTGKQDRWVNGNLRVPVMGLSRGGHNQKSQYKLFRVGDRSHLSGESVLNILPAGIKPPSLRVKVAPADLQWLGGGRAVYKPLFQQYFMENNGTPVQARPPAFSRLYAESQEIAPSAPGLPNFSPDYPNIPAERFTARTAQDTDVIARDAVINKGTLLDPSVPLLYAVQVPKYQPANRYPLGRGYATINPTNQFATQIWKTANDPNVRPDYVPSYPTDTPYLTRVYADTNGSRSVDTNEAFRAFVSRVQVDVDEGLTVAESTVQVPGSTVFPGPPAVPVPPGIAHGFVPFTHYGRSDADNPFGDLQALANFQHLQSPLFQPFTLVNSGNVNLWNVRLEKGQGDNRLLVDPMRSDTVDPNPIRAAQGNAVVRNTGVIPAYNLQSTLDPDPSMAPSDPRSWIPVRKPPVSMDPKAAGNRIKVFDLIRRNPDLSQRQDLPSITTAVPLGTPVGTYETHPMFFEDGKFAGAPGVGGGAWLNGADGRYTRGVSIGGGTEDERYTKDMNFAVSVMEARATGFAPLAFSATYPGPGGIQGYIPASNDDPRNSPAATGGLPYPIQLPFGIAPNSARWTPRTDTSVPAVSNAEPAAYRDAGGNMRLLWMSSRKSSGTALQEFTLWTSMLQYTVPVNPVNDPQITNPWGWRYNGIGARYFDPSVNTSWWSEPTPVAVPTEAADFRTVGSPAVVPDNRGEFGGGAYVFFVATTDVPDASSTRHLNQVYYLKLNDQGQPQGSALRFPWSQETPFDRPQPFFFTANGQPRLGLVWHAGESFQWKLYLSSVAVAQAGDPTKWTAPFALATPASLKYVMEPNPYIKAKDSAQPYIDVVFTGFNTAENNLDIHLERFTPDPQNVAEWLVKTLPAVQNEPVRRANNGPTYFTRGIDWTLETKPVITWIAPNGFRRVFDTPVQQNGLLVYTLDHYKVTANPASGTIVFTSDRPDTYPLPLGSALGAPTPTTDQILVTYQPRALRLSRGKEADREPIYFIDRSEEYLPVDQRSRMQPNAGQARVNRDRMWVIWRKDDVNIGGGTPPGGTGSQGPGTTRSSTLFYSTYRLMVQLPHPIAIRSDGYAQVSVSGAAGPWTVDAGKGRVIFTEADESQPVTVTYSPVGGGTQTISATASWQPEAGQNQNPEVAAPLKVALNEGQVWAFKDPLSQISASDPNYNEMQNNNIWLFWTSSRAEFSDVFYATISPQLQAVTPANGSGP